MFVEVRVHLQKSLQGTLDKAKSGLDQACQIFTHHDRQELAISRHAIVRGKKPYIYHNFARNCTQSHYFSQLRAHSTPQVKSYLAKQKPVRSR